MSFGFLIPNLYVQALLDFTEVKIQITPIKKRLEFLSLAEFVV